MRIEYLHSDIETLDLVPILPNLRRVVPAFRRVADPDLRPEGCDLCPVEQISWRRAQDFIAKLNALDG